MATEIEHKFLIVDDSWRSAVVRSQHFEQGYLAVTADCAVRVRIAGQAAEINIKSATLDIERREYEYAIPVGDAKEMLRLLCQGRSLTKVRHWVAHNGDLWEVDVFEGDNEGLVIAELEVRRREQHFEIPEWAGREVSGDPRYLNSSLAVVPYRSWEHP